MKAKLIIGMMPLIILCTALLILSSGCAGDGSNKGEQGQPTQEVSYFKTLLVIGDDRSGSTNDIRKLTADEYREIFEKVSETGGGAVAVCLIGNPLPQSREPFSLPLKALENIKPFDPKDHSLTLSQKNVLRKKNEEIVRQNQSVIAKNKSDVQEFIKIKLIPNVTDYKPSGQDQTDLDDAIGRINTLINEPQYKDFEKIIVVMVSDGINQPESNKIKPITNKLSNKRTEIFLVGWEGPEDVFDGMTVSKLSSKDGLIQIINNLKIN